MALQVHIYRIKPREENASDIYSLQAVSVLGHVNLIDPLLGTPHGPGDHAARQRRHSVRRRGIARVKISTEAPPPKSLEVEPGNEMTYSLNDILDVVIYSASLMDDVIMMTLGLYSNVWLVLIIIGTQKIWGGVPSFNQNLSRHQLSCPLVLRLLSYVSSRIRKWYVKNALMLNT